MANFLQELNYLSVWPLPSGPVTLTLTTNTDAQLIAAPGALLSLYILVVSASNTSLVLTRLDLREGPAGTIKYSMGLAVSGGGFIKRFEPWWKLPANTAFTGILGTAVTDVRVNIDYFIQAT